MRPHKWQPTRLSRPWDSPGKNTGVGCHFLLHCMKVKSESEVSQSCPTFSDPMDCSPPGSSIHGIFQARVLEWGAIASSDLNVYLYLNPMFITLSVPFPSPHQNLLEEEWDDMPEIALNSSGEHVDCECERQAIESTRIRFISELSLRGGKKFTKWTGSTLCESQIYLTMTIYPATANIPACA